MTEMVCPSCRATLLTLQQPCYKCGMAFLPNLPCPACGQLESKHLRQCPRRRGQKLKCPLCGGRRHRHDKTASRHECLWHQWWQWQVERGLLPKDHLPVENSSNLAQFGAWVDLDPNRLAGCVDAERIIRQQRREEKRRKESDAESSS